MSMQQDSETPDGREREEEAPKDEMSEHEVEYESVSEGIN